MKILIIEPCIFMRLGMRTLLDENADAEILDVKNLTEGVLYGGEFQPNIIFVNITNQCCSNHINSQMIHLLQWRKNCRIYCYFDAQYPESEMPIMIVENTFIVNKHKIDSILSPLRGAIPDSMPYRICTQPYSIFSDQEVLVMNDWMAEIPNYKIARKLNISDRTVYVHKRHITKKIKVKNRLEFCFIYKLIKYLYWPINHEAQRPLSRQTKSDLITLLR